MKPYLFDYLDYRKYILDIASWFRQEDSSFSFSAFAKLLGSNSPEFLRELRDRRFSVSGPHVELLAKYLKLGDRETDYLRSIVAFDAMTGAVDPPLDGLMLPQTAYSGVKLLINPSGLADSGACAIAVGGTFVYTGETRRFDIRLKTAVSAVYRAPGSAFTPAPSGAAARIVLDASQWLDSVYLGSCLDNGYVALDRSGGLTVDEQALNNPCQNNREIIRRNVAGSGSLILTR